MLDLGRYPSLPALVNATPPSDRPPSAAAPIHYPKTRRDELVEDYHGTAIADPYRWLEDDMSEETEAWVDAQNRVTFRYLAEIPFRDALRDRLTQLLNYPRISAPTQKKHRFLFAKNDGLQNQAVYYLQEGEEGAPQVLLDPNVLSVDSTTRVSALTFDASGNRLAYMVSVSGSDWQEIRIIDTQSRAELPDRVEWVKVSDLAWHGNGFFYSRYPVPSQHASSYSSMNEDHQVFYHALGTAQAADRLVYRDAANPQRFHHLSTTDDERFAVLYVSDRGQGKDGTAFSILDLSLGETAFRAIWPEFDDEMNVLDNCGASLLVVTNRNAPNRRVVQIDLAHIAETAWQTVIPERSEPIDGVTTAGGRIFVTYLLDVTTRAYVYTRDGHFEREIVLPAIGSATGFAGEPDATSVFYTFTSFTAPPTVYRYDIATGASMLFREQLLPFDPTQFATTQVFVPSKDGTRIPAFIVAKHGLVLDGSNPTLAYGYGGFNIALPPVFSAFRIAFLEQGGVFVQCNLRGGGEYGEAWHKAGMREKKQNVFDDFIAILEWLIGNGYTRADRLAVQGGSNGGLLVGALMTQRPDLVRVALPAVGVMDMLRFHKFTIGWNWIADYGSSDSAEDFAFLSAYSPLHQLRDGVSYPATMILTADHDDRVVPAHSFKFAARLQAAHCGENPVLIRVETKSGHGSSSLAKSIEETADVYAFLFQHLGLAPVFPHPTPVAES